LRIRNLASQIQVHKTIQAQEAMAYLNFLETQQYESCA